MAKASESVTRASPVVERALSKIVTKEDLGGALIAVDKAGSIDNAANSEEDAFAQIKRFLILHKELDADDGELTRTRKVRRNFIAERYERRIEEFEDALAARKAGLLKKWEQAAIRTKLRELEYSLKMQRKRVELLLMQAQAA